MSNAQLVEVQQIHDQIKQLQERAELLMLEGRSAAIDQIKSMMAAYKIEAVDLGLVLKAPPRNRGPAKNPRPAKYRDPDSGATWTGQGAPPKWLEGKNRDDYLVTKTA